MWFKRKKKKYKYEVYKYERADSFGNPSIYTSKEFIAMVASDEDHVLILWRKEDDGFPK